MTKATKRIFTVLSILLLISALFLPIYSDGGGIFTLSAKYNFARIVGDCIVKEGTLKLWVVHMTAGIFVPAAAMLACSLTGMRFYYAVFNTLGLLVWFFNFFRLAIDKGFMHLIDGEKTDIALGAWLAILFFLISSLILLSTKRKTDKEEKPRTDGRCPHCGIRLRGNIDRCPRCNTKLKTRRKT
ncbi:MAG: hypothetical protein IKT46_02415 [Clostridia bacterium]|nr:hypothetical protein [Clostridia bacterium]